VLGQFNAFVAIPASVMSGYNFLVIVDSYLMVIGLENETFSNSPGRGGVPVAIKP